MSTVQQHNLGDQQLCRGDANRLMRGLLIAAIAASGISMIFSIGTAVASASDQPPAPAAAGGK